MSATPERRVSLRPVELITSRENRWIKRFRAALGGESAEELIGIEGGRLVETALRAGVHCEAVLVSESGARHLQESQELLPPAVHLLRTSDRLFAQLAGTETPQGIA